MLRSYIQIFETMASIEQMANSVLDNQPENSSETEQEWNPCLNMANKIGRLQASKQQQTVKLLAQRYFKFLYTARRGFYCTLCDADASKFYDSINGSIKMTHGFC
jgi:hypothetical protein